MEDAMKKVTLGITGTIGANDIINHILYLKKYFHVDIILTQEAKKFVPEQSLIFYADNVYSEMYDQKGSIPHVNLGKEADIFIILPASANTISKISSGIADNLLTASILNFTGPLLIAPNMNQNMWKNPIIQDNVNYLKEKGHIFINQSHEAYIACERIYETVDVALPKPHELIKIIKSLYENKILE